MLCICTLKIHIVNCESFPSSEGSYMLPANLMGKPLIETFPILNINLFIDKYTITTYIAQIYFKHQ